VSDAAGDPPCRRGVDRRQFLRISLAVVLSGPLPAGAQQAGRIPRIAFLTTTSPGGSPTTDAFMHGLRELGYVEGRNLAVEWRWGRGSTERFSDFAAEVVRSKVDIIVAANDVAGRAAQRATKTIPIVIPTIGDPVGGGFAATLSRPGGNITGLTTQGTEVAAKRFHFFKETLPHLPRMGLLVDVADLSHEPALREVEAAARILGVQLRPRVDVSNPATLAGAFATLRKEGSAAVFTIGGTTLYANRRQLAELALNTRLPMACSSPEFVSTGCLMTYSANLADIFRRAAGYVDRILKGAKPGDLPIEQPTKFDLVINLKTAKVLGLTIPASLLARADHVIE
jgi:putative tryptophan/tyrosine transport system substrate-binding protein